MAYMRILRGTRGASTMMKTLTVSYYETVEPICECDPISFARTSQDLLKKVETLVASRECSERVHALSSEMRESCAKDLEGLVAYIEKSHPKNIICMLGAGLSTAAGIPDFRMTKSHRNTPRVATVVRLGLFQVVLSQARCAFTQ
eukprot:3964663-Amphidinium_carterae.1